MSDIKHVAQQFGQFGSAFQNLAKPVYPPQGKVIVAIQFLADNTPTELITEQDFGQGYQYLTTVESDETNNFLGVTSAACTGTTTTKYIANDTVQISAANSLIKAGQNVLLINDSDTVNAGLTVDSETATPVYKGKGATSVKVIEITGTNSDKVVLSAALTPTSSQTLIFLDEKNGAGGTSTDGVKYPAGITIYGRWTKVVPEADADGGIICYFGL
jgi:hypothetical protein